MSEVESSNQTMVQKNMEQKEMHPASGGVILILTILVILASIASIVFGIISLATGKWVLGGVLLGAGVLFLILSIFPLCGLRVVGPNEALVLTLFGNYHGTILKQGFYFVNPFTTANSPEYNKAKSAATQLAKESDSKGQIAIVTPGVKKTISLKTSTLDNGRQKVNDVLGNPIIIGAVVIWKVINPTKAAFNVEDYRDFLSIQTDSTIRNIARLYPYDSMDTEEEDKENEKTLRSSSQEIAENMKTELERRVQFAGLEIEEVRVTHLSYAEEIAAAMLQRQQATAVIAARQKIVDGAVSMVKMAIDKLSDEEVVLLDEERKAAMVSNLLVVLCSNKDTQPIVNSGSIY